MFPVTSQLPPAWVLPVILEDLATASSDLEALGMCLQRLREEGGAPGAEDAARLWALVEEARSFASEIRANADGIARGLVDAFLTPEGWPLEDDEEERFREVVAARQAARGSPADCRS